MIKSFTNFKKVIFCKKCVISNQRPNSSVEFKSKSTDKKVGIKFDKNGVCSACRYNEIKDKINWKDREKKLIKLLDKFRRKSGYDVVVPGSGGKDSGFTAHILKYKYGMNPLTVTWAPNLYTDIGWRNLQSWSHVGGIDNLLFTPNGKLHRKLTSLAFINLLHPFQPFIIGQKIIGPLMALKFNIPLVFYGENQAEYGNLLEENYIPRVDKKFFSNQKVDNIYLGGKTIKEISRKYNFKMNDFTPYIPPKFSEIVRKKVEFQYLGYYLKWDLQECFYYSSQNTGFKPNTERTEGTYSKYSSIDDKIDNFHFFTTLIKFGLGRASMDASQEIRTGKITREEGVQLVKLYDQEFPKKYFHEFLEYIDISEKKFWQTINKFRPQNLWFYDKKKQDYVLKNEIK